MNDVVVLRGLIKSDPELRASILNELSQIFSLRGVELSDQFLEKITIASSDELSMSGAHVVELDWSSNSETT